MGFWPGRGITELAQPFAFLHLADDDTSYKQAAVQYVPPALYRL